MGRRLGSLWAVGRAALTLSLVAGLVVGLPPAAVVAAEPEFMEPSVPVSAVGGKVPGVDQPPQAKAIRPVWPSAASAQARLDAGAAVTASSWGDSMVTDQVSPGGLPVSVAVRSSGGSVEVYEQRLMRGLPAEEPAPASAVSAVDVTVLDRAVSSKLGIRGVAFTATVADALSSSVAAAGSAMVDFTVDYSAFAGAYGGGYSDRLRLVILPACALTTPQVRECRIQTPVPGGRNDKASASVTGSVDLATQEDSAARSFGAQETVGETSGQVVLAVTAGSSSEQGDWAATSLSQAASWAAGSSGGGFTYSVPVQVPPVPGGLAPKISLDYSSASIDGLTKSTSSQASWIGEGWNYEPGFVERTYRPCPADGGPWYANDLCWVDIASVTVVLNGVSTRLFRNDADGTWKAEDDSAGWRVERLTGMPNGAREGEAFKITTRDGTQYFFGSRPRSEGGGALNVEVYGKDPGEPCYQSSGFAYSHCPMPYRWNLDQIVDVHGNVIDYNWGVFRGSYGGNGGADVFAYDVYGWLKDIQYGKNINAGAAGGSHTAKVEFVTTYRCFQATDVCDDAPSSNQQHWLDTPWDLFCYDWATSCANTAPVFFSIYRLTEIRTYVWDAVAGNWGSIINSLFTTQDFPSTGDLIAPAGDDSSPSLGLWRIWRTGHPQPIEMRRVRLDNRVDYGTDKPPMTHWRIEQISTGTGGSINIIHSGDMTGNRECWPGDLSSIVQDQNNRRCFPQNTDGVVSWWHRYVVTDVYTRDYWGGAPDEHWHYDYSTANSSSSALWKHDQNMHKAPSERTWSRWAGYPTVWTTHGAYDGTGPKQVTETLFHRGMHGDKTLAGGWGSRQATIDDAWDHAIVDSEALAGRVRRTFTWDGPANSDRTNWTSAVRHHHSITQTGSYYIPSNPTIVANRVRETEIHSGTKMAGPSYRWTVKATTYEPTYGLPVKVHEQGDVSIGSDDRCTTTQYAAPNTSAWIIGRPSQVVVDTCATSPTAADILAASRTFYDNAAWGAVPVRGLVTTSKTIKNATANPPAAADWFTTARSTYDTYGRVIDTFDALDRKTSTAYTPSVGGPVTAVAVTGPMGAGWTMTTHLDPRFGVPVKVTDINGKVYRASYDEVGRLLKVWKHNRPTNQTPDVEYVYTIGGPNAVSTRALGPDGQQITSIALFDGLLRPRQTQAPAANGTGRTITDTIYNGLGLVAKQSTFYNSSEPVVTVVGAADKDIKIQQRYTYDNLGRTTAEQQWSGNGTSSAMLWQTTHSYDGDKYVRTTPPAGGTATTVINDAQGRTIELRQHLGGTPSGSVATTTTYTHDRMDRLTKVTDTADNHWTYEYDLLGRKTKTIDPDAGTSTSSYDNAGQVISTTDARGQALHYEYDSLGRKIRQRNGSANGPVMAQWVYDTHDLGQLAESIRYDGTDQYKTRITSRDDAYRPLHTEVEIPATTANGGLAGVYAWGYSYKVNGAPHTVDLPGVGGLNAEKLTHTYNAIGLLETLSGTWSDGAASQTYINNIDYNYDGLIAQQLLGDTDKQVRLSNAYDPTTRRLTTQRIDTEDQTTPGSWVDVYTNGYAYDPAGNITSVAGITGGTADQKECFTYDHLRRLTEAWTQTTGDCTTPQRAGVDPYWRQWTFDSIGNRLTQTDKDPVAGDTTWTYQVGTANGVTPHQLKQVDATGPLAGTATRTFTYDPAGNMTSATTATGNLQTLTWDADRHLASVTEGSEATSYLYDADGNRLISRAASNTTLYLPDNTELELSASGGPILGTRYYAGIAVRSATGLKWVCSNHQGSSTVQIDSTTLDTDRRRMMPFGEARGAQPSGWMGTKGYVGGTKDDTGLTHLSAREYDPTLGRFISVDPIMDRSDPQQWHGYAYSHNSPITFSDPTGLRDTCDSEGNYVCMPPPQDTAPPPPPEPEEPPTVGEIIEGALDRNAKEAGYANTDALFDDICGDNPACKQAVDTLLEGVGGEPFSCDAFPDPEMCKSETEAWLDKAYKHLEFYVGLCDVICIDLEFQGGVLQLVLGFGAAGAGGGVNWNSLLVDEQNPLSFELCGAVYVGACGGAGIKVNERGDWTGAGWVAGISFGMGETKPAVGYNLVSFDFRTMTFAGPENPLPPVVDRWFTRNCGNIWWCNAL